MYVYCVLCGVWEEPESGTPERRVKIDQGGGGERTMKWDFYSGNYIYCLEKSI